MTGTRHLRRVAASLAGLTLVLGGCANDAELDTLEPKGESARSIDTLLNQVLIGAAVIFVLVIGAVVYMSVRNRVKDYEGERDVFPTQLHGNFRLEILWTIVPALILAVFAVLTLQTLFELNDDEANAVALDVGGESTEWEPTVLVVGQQWWWEYRYYFDSEIDVSQIDPFDMPPADIVTSGQMVIPADEEIELFITSRDVIHSHWIPALNGKRDAVPGRVSPWKLGADEPGVYFGQCTEYCALSHSRMRMQTIALDDADFQQWVTDQMEPAEIPAGAEAYVEAYRAGEATDVPADTAEQRGLVLFTQQCASCHVIDGVNDATFDEDSVPLVPGAAPNLTHFASRSTFIGGVYPTYLEPGVPNRNQLEAWLRNPTAVKPMVPDDQRGMPTLGLTEAQIDDLVAYLYTLGEPPADFVVPETEVE